MIVHFWQISYNVTINLIKNEKEKFLGKMFDRNGKGYISLVDLLADSKK